MKKNILFLLITSIVLLNSCQAKKEKENNLKKENKIEPASKIDKEELLFAKDLANNILTKQKNGSFYELSREEATIKMVEGLNETVQKNAYKQVESLFGDYKDLTFNSLVIGKHNIKIYRFKGIFESNADIEVRVVLNATKKLAGFFIKPWTKEV